MKTTKINLYEIIAEETINLFLEEKGVLLLNEGAGGAFGKRMRVRRQKREGVDDWRRADADPLHPQHSLRWWRWPGRFLASRKWVQGVPDDKHIDLKARYKTNVTPALERLQNRLKEFFHRAAASTTKTEGEAVILDMKGGILDDLNAAEAVLNKEINIINLKLTKLNRREARPGVVLTNNEKKLLPVLESARKEYINQKEDLRAAVRELLPAVNSENVFDIMVILKNIEKEAMYEGINMKALRKKFGTSFWGPEPKAAPITGGVRPLPGSLGAVAIVHRAEKEIPRPFLDKFVPMIRDIVDGWVPKAGQSMDERIDIISALSGGQFTTKKMWNDVRGIYIAMEEGQVVNGEIQRSVRDLLERIKGTSRSGTTDEMIRFLNETINDYSDLMKNMTKGVKHPLSWFNIRKDAGGWLRGEWKAAKRLRTKGIQNESKRLNLNTEQTKQLNGYIKEKMLPEFRTLQRTAWRIEKALRYVYKWGREAGKEGGTAKRSWQDFNVSLDLTVAVTEALRILMNIYPVGSAEYKAMKEMAVYREGFWDLFKFGNWYTPWFKKQLRRVGPELWARRAFGTTSGRLMMLGLGGGTIYWALFDSDQYFASCCSDIPGSPRKDWCCYTGGLGPGPGSFLTDMKNKFLKTGAGFAHLAQAGVDVFQLFKIYTYSFFGTVYAQFSDEVEQKQIDAAIESMRKDFNKNELTMPIPRSDDKAEPGRALKSPSEVHAKDYQLWGSTAGERFREEWFKEAAIWMAAKEFTDVLRKTPGPVAQRHGVANLPYPNTLGDICLLWPKYREYVQSNTDFGVQYLRAMKLPDKPGSGYRQGKGSIEGWDYAPVVLGTDHTGLRKWIANAAAKTGPCKGVVVGVKKRRPAGRKNLK